MPRKRKLDKWVTAFVDRHGTERFRFRRDGFSTYLPAPKSPDYKEAYRKACNGIIGISRVQSGTVNDLCARFYGSVGFKNVSDSWQTTLRQVIESFRDEFGGDMVANFETRHIDAIVALRMDQKVINGKKVGGTHAAHRYREVLKRLFKFAVKEKMIAANPVDDAEKVTHKATGYYTWTEADIRQYRERHPLGTKARLALELMLWTGMRRGNAHKCPPPVNGELTAIAVKTGKEFTIKVTRQLQAAIDAMPPGTMGEGSLLITEYGKPFSVAGFGNKMREWCDLADLPKCTSHGLRKALATRVADLGLSQQELMAIGQWANDTEAKPYIEKANRNRLANRGIGAVSDAELGGNIG